MVFKIAYRFAAVAVLALALIACAAPGPFGGVTPNATERPETEVPGAQEPSAAAGRTVSAGMQTDFFSPYTVIVLPGWTDTRKSDASAPYDALTLIKDQYSILIGQGGGDGLMCLFGGVPTPEGAAQLWLEFETGTPIANPSADLMRATTDGTTHTICEKSGDTYTTWTSFGSIIYTTPNPPAEPMLAEMDAMLASLALAN